MKAGLCEEATPWMVATDDGRFDLADFGYLPDLAWYDSRDPYRPLQFEWFARKAFTPRCCNTVNPRASASRRTACDTP